MVKAKLKIGIFSLTSCEGCCFAVIDLGLDFLKLQNDFEINNFRLFEADEHKITETYDLVFIEGSPLTAENIKLLKSVRSRAKVLVAMGTCAVMGGIYHLKAYQDKLKLLNYVYQTGEGIENFEVKTTAEIVKVDYILPGCPITADEFVSFLYQFKAGKIPKIKQQPVCHECQSRGYECVLQNGKICLGPITCGGCKAICLKSKQGCWGCRGLLEDAEVDNLIKKLKEKYTDREIIKSFEMFGVKELINRL